MGEHKAKLIERKGNTVLKLSGRSSEKYYFIYFFNIN